jgi:hypothetical protein
MYGSILETKNIQTTVTDISMEDMYNEETNAHLINSLLNCSLFIVPTCSNDDASSSGSSYSLPTKLH